MGADHQDLERLADIVYDMAELEATTGPNAAQRIARYTTLKRSAYTIAARWAQHHGRHRDPQS